MTFVEFAAHSAPGIDSLSVGAVRTRIGAEPTCLNFASSAQYQARHKIANFHEDFIQATSSCKRRAAILRIALLTGRDWDDAGRSPGHPILFDLNFRSAHSQTEFRFLLTTGLNKGALVMLAALCAQYSPYLPFTESSSFCES